MKIACDLDGAITAAPKKFAKLLGALHQAGEKITILTGGNPDKDVDTKTGLLDDAGCADCYDQLVIVDSNGVAENKAKWLVKNDIDVFIDNDLANCGTAVAAGVPLVLAVLTNDEKDLRARQRIDALRARLLSAGYFPPESLTRTTSA